MRKIYFDKAILWQGPETISFSPGLPSLSRRSNPLLVGSQLIVSSFKSKAIFSLDKQNGRMLWKYELAEYGGYSPSADEQRVYASTASRVICLEIGTGKKIWSYEPYKRRQASFYSDAILAGDRILISDRYGYLHCLHAKTGKIIWKSFLSTKGPFALNATVTIAKDKVYVISTGGELSCVDIANGKPLWVIYLDEGGIRPPIVQEKKIYLQGSRGLFIVDMQDLLRVKKVSFEEIMDICISGDVVYALERRRRQESSSEVYRILSVEPNNKVSLVVSTKYNMSDFAHVDDGEHIAILGADRISFLNVVTRKIDMQVIDGVFSSMPFVDRNYIYTVGMMNEAICLQIPSSDSSEAAAERY